MAFILPPVALLFIIVAAVFFWLSKDVVLTVVSKVRNFVENVAAKAMPSKTKARSNAPKTGGKASAGTKSEITKTKYEEPEHEMEMLRDFALPELTQSKPKSAGAQKNAPAKLVSQSVRDEVKPAPSNKKTDSKNLRNETSHKKGESKNLKNETSHKKDEPKNYKSAESVKQSTKQSAVGTKKSEEMSVSNVTSKISAVPGQLWNLINFRDADESPKESVHEQPYKEIAPNTGGVIDGVEEQFDNLDMMTASAISIMLCENKFRAGSPYLKGVKKPDIRTVLLKFCNDTYFATDIRQIDKLFGKSYYKRKIRKYLRSLKRSVRRGISDSFQVRVSATRARKQRNTFINKICETINNFESVKYIPALSGNEEISDSKRNYKLDHLNPNYKDALIYLVDLLLTCTCISKMLFVERMINEMDENSEFYTIIGNMAKSLDNHNMIINKSRPLYKQYYQSQLGYIHGDDLLYGLAITIMVNRIKKNSSVKGANSAKMNNVTDFQSFKSEMLLWLDALAKDGRVVDDVGALILRRITTTIKNDYGLLIAAFQGLVFWENHYYQQVAYYKKEEDRRRYLSGNFSK